MGDKSKIEWTDATWNPIRAHLVAKETKIGWHCEHVSEGCRNCYAERLNKRRGTLLDFKPGHRKDIDLLLDERTLRQPLAWKRPRMVFVCSMSDLFADFVEDAWIDRIFAVMALCPQHTFQVLTKRSARMRKYFEAIATTTASTGDDTTAPPRRLDAIACTLSRSPCASGYMEDLSWPLPNVWLGVSCEDEANAAARIPDLLATPAGVRFISAEPLLGPIDLSGMCNGHYFRDALTGLKYHDAPEGVHSATENGPRIDWVIAGGESGPQARPAHPDWFRSLRDQCAAAGVPYFFKQWGEWAPITDDPSKGASFTESPETTNPDYHLAETITLRCAASRFPDGQKMFRLGKGRAGRTIDGRIHDEFPAIGRAA